MTESDRKLPVALSKLDKAEKLFLKDYITAAYQLLLEFDSDYEALSNEDKTSIENALKSDILRKIRSYGSEMFFLLNLVQQSEAWKIWCRSKDMTLSSQEDEENKGQFYFKVEGIIDVEPLYIVAALMEVDLYPTWMSRCVHAEILKSISPYSRLVYSIMDYFFFKRESLMTGYDINAFLNIHSYLHSFCKFA